MQHLIIDNIAIAVHISPSFDATKKTLVFLHDSLGCIELWRDFPEQLAQLTNCNAIVYDRQGYGKSDPAIIDSRDRDYLTKEAHTLFKILNSLHLKSCILFGHSDGGSIALLAAAIYPNTFEAIITEGAHVFVEDKTLDGIIRAKQAYKTTSLKSKLEKYHGSKTNSVFKLWTETWLSKDFKKWDITGYLKKIQCPTLVIQGYDDEYGTEHQVMAIINMHPLQNAEAYMIPKTGHSPHKECPELVLLKVQQFISKIS
ncbi:alpha/beta fold hydrolase [Aquimarina sp. W85]|uniref:alpha/beta fold hydrolase n=1 Tax=Aquimarina rhodophyticola TaxID=3342246 RepID=UPI00366AF114